MSSPPFGPRSAMPGSADPSQTISLAVSSRVVRLDPGMFSLSLVPAAADRSGLPAVRVSLPPGPPGRRETVSIDAFRGDGWMTGSDEATLLRVLPGGADVLVTMYWSGSDPGATPPPLKLVRLNPDGAPAGSPTAAPTRALFDTVGGAGAAATATALTSGLPIGAPGEAGAAVAIGSAVAGAGDMARGGFSGRGSPAAGFPGGGSPGGMPSGTPGAMPGGFPAGMPPAGIPPAGIPPAVSRPATIARRDGLGPVPGGGGMVSHAEVVAHIEGIGDVDSKFGEWAGMRGSGRAIEGFSLTPGTGLSPEEYEIRAVLGADWLSPWLPGGSFCGSRGLALPLRGFSLRLHPSAAARFELVCFARFVDGSDVGPVGADILCTAPSLAALEAFQVQLRPRGG